MNNFLADGWLVGDSKQQASGSLLMPVMNNLHGSHSTVAFVALLPFSNCVLTFLLLPFLRDKPVHRQLPVKVISGASSQLRLSDFNASRLQVLHIDKDYSPIVIYRFAVNYSFVSAWEKKTLSLFCNELLWFSRLQFSFLSIVKKKVCTVSYCCHSCHDVR